MRLGLFAGLLLLAAGLAWAGPPEAPGPAPRVVSVVSGSGPGAERATGFVLRSGRVVTVAHAVEGARTVAVWAGGRPRPARVVRRDRRTDLALLAVPGLMAPALETASVEGGSSVRLLLRRGGAQASRSALVRRAIIAHVRAASAERALRRPALELRARTRAGDSGAPVLTERGRLAGVLFARSNSRAGTAYAVDAAALGRRLLSTHTR